MQGKRLHKKQVARQVLLLLSPLAYLCTRKIKMQTTTIILTIIGIALAYIFIGRFVFRRKEESFMSRVMRLEKENFLSWGD